MATTYKFLTSGVETLTANVFADQVEIYDGHRLDPCTMYVWFHDDLLGNANSITQVQAPTRIGAGGSTYDVDLSDVANSGEYYCEIRIGQTQDCWITTERRRISIVECLDQTDRTFAATGASGSFRVNAPHYEMPVFNNEGNDWINGTGLITCDTQTDNVCLFVQNFTLDDQLSSSNSARRGQPTITVGELVCFYNTVQDYIDAPPAAPTPDMPNGPFINLSQDGPAFVNTNVAVTAEVGTVGGTGSETYTVAWTNATVDPVNDRRAIVNSATAGTTEVTATVTDNNGQTASATINVVHNAVIVFGTTVTGTLSGGIQNRGLFGNTPQLTDSGTITVTGGGNWFVRMTLNPTGFFAGPVVNSGIRVTVTGPGVNFDETITSASTFITREFQMENLTGTYNWTLAWNPRPGNSQSWAQGSVGLFARLF